MLGKETQFLEHLTYNAPALESYVHYYVDKLTTRVRTAHKVLREQQLQIRSGDSDDPSLYKVGNWVWMNSYRRQLEQVAKLQPKFVGPCCVIEVMPNHTYKMER